MHYLSEGGWGKEATIHQSSAGFLSIDASNLFKGVVGKAIEAYSLRVDAFI